MNNNAKTELQSIESIQQMVHQFYGYIRNDELLGPIFESRIADQWEDHLEKMVRFWETVLTDHHTYLGAPFPPHATMPIDEIHFQRWMALFTKTISENFTGEGADKALNQGIRMAQLFLSKIKYFRGEPFPNFQQ